MLGTTLFLLLFCGSAVITATAARLLAGAVAVKLGHPRIEGERAAGTAGFSLVANPKQR